MPEISIAVPSYNRTHFVSRTIRSCLVQRASNLVQCWPTLYRDYSSQLLTSKLLLSEWLGASASCPALTLGSQIDR
jgi:hypothetical protein